MTRAQVLTAQRLRELLAYDQETGAFTWIDNRPLNPIKGEAGRLHPEGYRTIKVEGRNYQAHRLAWLYVHGEWPTGQIDHVNRNRGDNRLANLRPVTNSENQQNTVARNRHGLKGVHWNKSQEKWTAKIGLRNRRIYLGVFATKEEAHAAYCAAAARFHTCNPEGSL